MAKDKGAVVGSPVTPELLFELGAFTDLPVTAEDFSPSGAWTNTYRVWTCHGYRKSGNDSPASLRIVRTPGATADGFRLQVREQIANNEGRLDTTTGDILCRLDQLASPLRWKLSTAFTSPDDQAAPELGIEEEVTVEGERLRVRTCGRSAVRRGSRQLAVDWCLFEAVQRLPRESKALTFDMLERLALLKPGQRLISRGDRLVTLGRRRVTVHVFQQFGRGVLPFDYFVDQRGRLLMVTTGSKAYLLDDQAEDEIRRKVKQSQQWWARQRKRGK